MIRDDGTGQASVERAGFSHRLDVLKRTVADLENRLADVHSRIGRLTTTTVTRPHAVVNPVHCTGCAICEQVCPQGAIRVLDIARVDASRCTGCGVCVQNCPQEAIHLAT